MEGNSLKTFENLCKIFEMRIKLDREKNIDTPIDVLINYEKYSKKIDSIYNDDFEKEIKGLISPSDTLEKEEKRLKKLIKLLEDRIEKRDELEDNFYLITGKNIKGLQMVVSSAELNEKKDRLNTITKYLDTKNEIESITESVIKLKDELDVLEVKNKEYFSKNKILEDDLYSYFIDFLHDDEYFAKINEENLNDELVKIIENVKETKETLDVTKDSVSSLIDSLDGEDYSSYVEDAEKSYFVWKNREIILRIYESVCKFEEEFNEIFDKRKNIISLVDKRNNLREELRISDINELEEFEKILDSQMSILREEKDVIDNISNYSNRIKFKEERLSELEEENSSVEILAILKEFGLIETYDNDEIEEEISSDDKIDNLILEEKEEDNIIIETIDPYRIVEIKDYPRTLNIGLAKLKGESVRDKVNKKLNPKKTFEDLLNSSDEQFAENDIKVNTPITNEPIVSELNSSNVLLENEKDDVSLVEAPVWEIPDVTNDNDSEKNIPVWDSNDSLLDNKIDDNSLSDSLTWNIPDSPIINEIEKNEGNNIPIWNSNDSLLVDKNIDDVPDSSNLNIEKEDINKINTPVWGDVKPIFEPSQDSDVLENTDMDINIDSLDNSIETGNDNMFWVPVSDSKLETGSIPNFNTTFKKSSEFDFPEL